MPYYCTKFHWLGKTRNWKQCLPSRTTEWRSDLFFSLCIFITSDLIHVFKKISVYMINNNNIIPLLEVKVTQLCLTLCDPMDYTVHGTLQARILEWIALPFSRGSSQPRDRTQVSPIAGRFFTSWATREALSLVQV